MNCFSCPSKVSRCGLSSLYDLTDKFVRRDPFADSDLQGLPDCLADDQRDFDGRLFVVGGQVKVAFINEVRSTSG